MGHPVSYRRAHERRPLQQHLPGSVLRTVPAAVRVVVLDNAGLLLDDVGARARACHRRAQEHVDDEHDEEHEAERYAQVQQPRGPDAVGLLVAQRQAAGRLAGLEHEHRGAGRQRAVVRLRVDRERVPGRLLCLLQRGRAVAAGFRARAPAHLDVALEVQFRAVREPEHGRQYGVRVPGLRVVLERRDDLLVDRAAVTIIAVVIKS